MILMENIQNRFCYELQNYMCLQVTNFDSCDEGSEKSSDQQYCSSQSSDFSPVSQMSDKELSPNSLETNSFCLSRGTTEKDVATVEIKVKLSQKEEGNLMNVSSTFAAEKFISNETDVSEIGVPTAMSCFSARDGNHSNFEIASDCCVQNETAEENYEQAMNLCISDSHGPPLNLFCHRNDGLRKPRKATPVKRIGSSNGVSEFVQEKLTNEGKISKHLDVDPMSADVGADSLSCATGSTVIKVPVYKCSVSASSEKELSSSAYMEMNNSSPLDLCVRGSPIARKSESCVPEQSSVDDLSAQILLLSGKEYEIISLGGGRWISRNEYDLQKGLGPRKLVSKVPGSLQTNDRGFHPKGSQPHSVANRQLAAVINDPRCSAAE